MAPENTPYICTYAASSTQLDAAYFQAARRLGQLLAQRGYGIINGAGKEGLMRAVADGALEEGGPVTGIIPQFMVDCGWHYERLTRMIVTPTMHERKRLMAEQSAGIIALPGGCGTLEELLEAITWKQLGLYTRPIVILNTNRFYDPLLLQLRNAVDGHFMQARHANLWHEALTPEEAVEHIANAPEWDIRLSKVPQP